MAPPCGHRGARNAAKLAAARPAPGTPPPGPDPSAAAEEQLAQQGDGREQQDDAERAAAPASGGRDDAKSGEQAQRDYRRDGHANRVRSAPRAMVPRAAAA